MDLTNLYKRKMGGWRRPKKATSDRWNRNWSQSHGTPPDQYIMKEKREMHWEREFCTSNGITWEQLLEAKRFLPLFPKIINWNDSAGKEAFKNAKARYLARINGRDQHDNNPLPDPDHIDPDERPSNLDLLSDSDEWGDGGVILLDSHYKKEEEVSVDMSTGWGE